MKNKNGKLACMLGTPAFLLSQVAEYASKHRYELIDNPMLSPTVNCILLPFRLVEAFLSSKPVFTEPSVMRLTIFYVFEGEAIIICFVASVFTSTFAIYFSFVAAKKFEFSIWYTNGFLLSILTLITANTWIGLVVSAVIMLFFNRIRYDH